MRNISTPDPLDQLAQPDLKMFVARALLAGGFGLAAIGLGAGLANALPLLLFRRQFQLRRKSQPHKKKKSRPQRWCFPHRLI
jgi:hypothetical protein